MRFKDKSAEDCRQEAGMPKWQDDETGVDHVGKVNLLAWKCFMISHFGGLAIIK